MTSKKEQSLTLNSEMEGKTYLNELMTSLTEWSDAADGTYLCIFCEQKIM